MQKRKEDISRDTHTVASAILRRNVYSWNMMDSSVNLSYTRQKRKPKPIDNYVFYVYMVNLSLTFSSFSWL